MKILENIDLTKYNTFHVHSVAEKLYQVESPEELKQLYDEEFFKTPFVVLGGGSNILFTSQLVPKVLQYVAENKEIIEEDNDFVDFWADAGANWNDLVKWSVENNYLGFQNLISIPGTVGASPIQNVGAYGVEVGSFITKVEYLDLEDGEIKTKTNEECEFEYRYSIFKKGLKGRFIITKVYFKLEKFKGEIPEKYIKYSKIAEKIAGREMTVRNLADTVAEIRKENLPDPDEYGSAGSIFENIIVSREKYEELLNKFPELPKFDLPNTTDVKVPVGYILEKLGWKNKRVGRSGTWKSHSLIIVNYEGADGDEIVNVMNNMKKDFFVNTGIELDTEVNII